jgi:exoribonuclease-2
VTGASEKGTWVRTWRPRVEGRLERGGDRNGGLDVGDRVRVKLISVNVERGFIDFSAC